MNERTWVMTPDMRRDASSREITAAMKAAGIKFDREECPVKITKPWDATENEDGSVTFHQWEDWQHAIEQYISDDGDDGKDAA